SLLIAAFGVGIISGIPIAEVADVIEEGFGGLMGSIGLVIIFGTIIGGILDRSGAALRMLELVLRIGVENRPRVARSIIGVLVCLSVFCVLFFIFLSSLKKALAK